MDLKGKIKIENSKMVMRRSTCMGGVGFGRSRQRFLFGDGFVHESNPHVNISVYGLTNPSSHEIQMSEFIIL